MNFLIIGSHGTGKSSLAKAVQEKYKGEKSIGILDGVSREAFKQGVPINEEATWESQLQQAALILDKQLESNKHTLHISSIERVLVYTRLLNTDVPKSFIETLTKIVSDDITYLYDGIIYLPIEFPIENDGIRSIDIEFQKKADEAVLEILKMCNGNFFVLKGSLYERTIVLTGIIEFMEKYKHIELGRYKNKD